MHKSLDEFEFGKIPPLTTELSALKCLKNRCHHFFSAAIDSILSKLAGKRNLERV